MAESFKESWNNTTAFFKNAWQTTGVFAKGFMANTQDLAESITTPWTILSEKDLKHTREIVENNLKVPFKLITRSYIVENFGLNERSNKSGISQTDGKTTVLGDLNIITGRFLPIVTLPFIVAQNTLHAAWLAASLASTVATWIFNYTLIDQKKWSETADKFLKCLKEIGCCLSVITAAAISLVATLAIRIPLRLMVTAWECTHNLFTKKGAHEPFTAAPNVTATPEIKSEQKTTPTPSSAPAKDSSLSSTASSDNSLTQVTPLANTPI